MDFSANVRKHVASLGKARQRRLSGEFVAEGTKCVLDMLPHFECSYVLATQAWIDEHSSALPPSVTVMTVKLSDIERMSSLVTPQPVLAVLRMPAATSLPDATRSLVLALDRVQDPGNLGTIIRVCDWFGVNNILASDDTVDVYSPKVVQATMGALSRVQVYYCDLPQVLSELQSNVPLYGTFLDGCDIYHAELSANGVIVMGNEGNGISSEVAKCINRRLLIPSYPPGEATSESLNVAMATGITLSEFRRRQVLGGSIIGSLGITGEG